MFSRYCCAILGWTSSRSDPAALLRNPTILSMIFSVRFILNAELNLHLNTLRESPQKEQIFCIFCCYKKSVSICVNPWFKSTSSQSDSRSGFQFSFDNAQLPPVFFSKILYRQPHFRILPDSLSFSLSALGQNSAFCLQN